MKQWYQELFQDYADKYDNESFTSGTTREVDFTDNESNQGEYSEMNFDLMTFRDHSIY